MPEETDVFVPVGVLDGIEDIANERVATKEDIRRAILCVEEGE